MLMFLTALLVSHTNCRVSLNLMWYLLLPIGFNLTIGFDYLLLLLGFYGLISIKYVFFVFDLLYPRTLLALIFSRSPPSIFACSSAIFITKIAYLSHWRILYFTPLGLSCHLPKMETIFISALSQCLRIIYSHASAQSLCLLSLLIFTLTHH